jgi:methylglutaconyl-CoA hydratase
MEAQRSEFTTIQAHRDGAVERLTLNRPDVRNAFDDRLIAEVREWASRVNGDPEVRVVVISGAGPSFSAGADLAWMAKMAGYTREENERDASAAADMFGALDTLRVPVIARIHGAALGGGAGLVAVADIAVATEDAVFGFTEVKLGLVPSVIGPYALAKIGLSAARELFLTGRRFSAAHAHEIGLVHSVVPVEQLDRTVQRYVDDLLQSGSDAVRAAKAFIREIAGRRPADVSHLTARLIAERRVSAEAQELMKAFLKKSKSL